jgi:hypothetical protein
MKLRPLTGRSETDAASTVELTWVRVVSTTGTSPVTSTASFFPATPNETGRFNFAPTAISTGFRTKGENPELCAVNSYVPTGTTGKRK